MATKQKQNSKAVQKQTGRPSSFTQEIGKQICNFIAAGGNLTRWCELNGRKYETVSHWMVTNDWFAGEYARAREARADARADRIDAIRDRVVAGSLDPNAARVAIDAEKWQAGKEQPKRYGDRLEIDGKVDAGGTVTLTEIFLLVQANANAAGQIEGK